METIVLLLFRAPLSVMEKSVEKVSRKLEGVEGRKDPVDNLASGIDPCTSFCRLDE
jgi:hypothetical protein